MRALIVDDKPDNLYYLGALLRGEGYEVEETENGLEALAAARRSAPDLLITDLLMPVMDGYTLLREWSADESLRHIPVVVYTATYTEPADERLALDLGAAAFIVKPAEPDELLRRLQAVAAATPPGRVASGDPGEEEAAYLRQYSERLVRKLEKKMFDLEESNRALQQDIAVRRRMAETQAAILDALPAHVALLDPSGSILAVNEAWRGFALAPAYAGTGFSVGVDYAAACERDGDRPARERSLVAQGIRSVLERRQPRFAHEYACGAPADTRWYRLEVAPLRDDRQGGAVVMHLDITEQRHIEERLRQTQKLEAIGRLASGIAHDFNNILAALLGNLELARGDLDPEHPACGSLEEAKRAGLRARELVDQILAFGRPQTRPRRILELAPVVEESVRFLRATLPAGVEIVLRIADDVPAVLGDATQIHQILLNLGANAWHAVGEVGGRIEIEVAPVALDAEAAARIPGLRPGPFVALSVNDNGHGMDHQTQLRIFEPFFTTKGPSRGTGLGLSVVHGIVQAHDGAITVSSQPGEGATFRVYLPAVQADEGTAASDVAPVQQGNGRSILYLDDEAPLVTLAKRALERLGYRVTGFTDAAEALSAFREQPARFDLVITDLNMPGISGLSVAREMLQIDPGAAIALTSGYVTDALKERAAEAGVRDVLHKPTSLEELGREIHRLATRGS